MQTTSRNGLEGQIALVTGAARGIGRAIATELARLGAHVIVADRLADEASDAAKALCNDGHKADGLALDIGDSAAVRHAFEGIDKIYRRLDILVNNAAIGQTVQPTKSLSDEEWDRVLGVTLTGTFYCCRATAAMMEKQGAGCIVNISSLNGASPTPLVTAYNVAKAGVNGLTKSLAIELAPLGIRVNAVAPGPVLTDFNKRVMAERGAGQGMTEAQMVEKVRASVPLGRWGEPEEMASVVAFLCGPGATFITGEIVNVGGGVTGVGAVMPAKH